MLEIINLDKAEVVSIDTLSNQELTEEECKRLRQSIKFGFINRLSVGNVLDKAMEIQMARVNDSLESETLRLSRLCDRANDLGRRKELRECVEKLQHLKSPEERQLRLEEIPEIHADPNMDPSIESDEDEIETVDSRRDSMTRSRSSSFNSRGRGLGDSSAKDAWSGSENVSSKKWELSRNLSSMSMSMNASRFGKKVNESSWNQGTDGDVQASHNLVKLSSSTDSKSEWDTRSRSESLSGASHRTSQASHSAATAETAVKVNETKKMWYYKDPSGKVQGPFSMVQLQKWNYQGYFPADLRIWRTTVEQENPILLTDALAGKYQREPATSTMHGSRIFSSHPDKGSGMSLHQDVQRPDQNPMARAKRSTENWAGNDSSNLPSPTPASGVGPENQNSGWGNEQVNPNMVWRTATPGSANTNVGPTVQVPAPGNTSGWVDPTGNYGAPIQGPAPGNVSSGWDSTPGWGASFHGPVPGNGWGPPSESSGTGLAQGNQNQGWGARGGSQGTWGGERNNNGGQYSRQRDRISRGGDSGFGGGRTWNGQSSFGGGRPGGSRPFNRWEMLCPYNTKGRCKKASRCDYRHI